MLPGSNGNALSVVGFVVCCSFFRENRPQERDGWDCTGLGHVPPAKNFTGVREMVTLAISTTDILLFQLDKCVMFSFFCYDMRFASDYDKFKTIFTMLRGCNNLATRDYGNNCYLSLQQFL